MNLLSLYSEVGANSGFIYSGFSVTSLDSGPEGLLQDSHLYDCLFIDLSQKKDPDLLAKVRQCVWKSRKPYIIMGDPVWILHKPLLLCGTMFPELRVFKHRGFESNIPLKKLDHPPHPPVYLSNPNRSGSKLDEWKDYVIVTGGANCHLDAAKDAMGLSYLDINREDLNRSTPPIFTQYVGLQVKEYLS